MHRLKYRSGKAIRSGAIAAGSLSLLLATGVLQGCSVGVTPGAASVVQTSISNLTITRGGTYSGTWSSNDPDVPAISITTDEPVVIQNAVLSGRGDLIRITGSSGANVTVQNVTGTGLDPQVAGRQRGSFVNASMVNSLVVQQCTLSGTRHGILVFGSNPVKLQILSNKVTDLEDRASDGSGGFMTYRPDLGHFTALNTVTAANGVEVAWNQIVQTMGKSSMQDAVNLYKTQGTAANPIRVHDNYVEGSSSPATAYYNGTGFKADGDATQPVTAFALFQSNEVVRTAGGGFMIASGHDITMTGNRVVSCGKNDDGSWYARSQVTAISLWNYYGSANYFNNVITGTTGGMVTPDANSLPVVSDVFVNTSDTADSTNHVDGNSFEDPCLDGGTFNPGAESVERTAWLRKLAANGKSAGDLHQP